MNATLDTKIRDTIDLQGYTIISNFLSSESRELQIEGFINLSTTIGNPVPHDREGKIIWDIKSDPPQEGSQGVITYSQHNHEADLHTDSQYSENPEDYFGLLTLRRARCGGGISYILTVADILSELDSSAEGRLHQTILKETSYPFIIPTIFNKKNGQEPEFNFGPILSDNEIRFRVDTIEKAIEYDPSLCTKEQKEAFYFLVNLVRSSSSKKEFFLEDNDLIFINNKTTLHGRSSFQDYDRHLLRIRMNKYN